MAPLDMSHVRPRLDDPSLDAASRLLRHDAEEQMIRVIVTYRAEPDAARYEQHAELCRRVPGATFRHGKVLRTLSGEPELSYYAEFEFGDMDSFQAVARSDELAVTGEDAAEMGVPHSVYLVEVA
jgi:hypothetical protein